jgi:pSer/pThr/pTyr-binding forkhead associated (FHA) protein
LNDEKASTCAVCATSLQPSSRRRAASGARDQDAPGTAGMIEAGLWQPTGIGSRRPLRSSGAKHERHYLVPPIGDPIKLEPSETALVLGRDDGCDVKIASQTVSRHHFEVSFKGKPPRPWIKDLGTKNGTRVNGKRIEDERELVDGDVVKIGEVSATYRRLEPGQSESDLTKTLGETGGETVAVTTDDVRSSLALGGDLSKQPMSEVLDRLQKIRATGTLEVEADGAKSSARLAKGEVVEANVGALTGDAGMTALRALQIGIYRFQPGAP